MPLFEVAILLKPTKKEIEEEGKGETLVFGPKAVVARDGQSAGIAAVMGVQETEIGVALGKIDLSRAEVLVRPF